MMPRRRGFARLMPLFVLTGLAAGTFALLTSARPVCAPERAAAPTPKFVSAGPHGELFLIAGGNLSTWGVEGWIPVNVPGSTVRGLRLCGISLLGVDLHGATFTDCDFRGCDFSRANLRGVTFEICDLRGAVLDRADLTGAVSYLTQWPAGYGTPLERWKRGIVEGVGP